MLKNVFLSIVGIDLIDDKRRWHLIPDIASI